jgi:hypothetical protein
MGRWGVRYGVSVTKAADPGSANATGQVQAPATATTTLQDACSQLGGVAVPPGVYVNPFRSSSSISPSRIDMGVDYFGTGPIVALGNGTVTYSAASGTGWGPFSCSGGHGGAVVYRLTDGPDKGRFVYVAEGIIPTVPAITGGRPTPVRTGEAIATFTGCIEIGWGVAGGDGTMAAALGQECTGGDPGCHSTSCGENMSELIHAVGGPAGVPQGPIFGRGC